MRFILLAISLVFGVDNFQQKLPVLARNQSFTNSFNIPSTVQLVGIMAQFPVENPNNPKTSGNGQFLIGSDPQEYIKFYNSNSLRCDGFLVDKPPHNAMYFKKQLESVSNYYKNVSNNTIEFEDPIIIENSNINSNGYYQLSNEMEYYAKGDVFLVELFNDALSLAKSDIEFHFNSSSMLDNVIFIVFHAGLSQDFSYPSLDPTIYDLKSAYIDSAMTDNAMIEGVIPTVINGSSIYTGIVLPETYNIIYYDVVEDIYGNPDHGVVDLCDYQYGMTGIFAFLLGYEFGLPPLFNIDSGEPGVGLFGLMDYGSNNGRGVIPAPPDPWTRIKAGWSNVDIINTSGSHSIEAYDISNKVYRINISEDEYFLIENRNNWLDISIDIDSLRVKYKIDEYQMGHWFDVITLPEEILVKNGLINIDETTGVITQFNHYDYGLPGSGILIWHIKEPKEELYLLGINNNKYDRHVQIEEADGSLDIGFRNYFPSWYFDATSGIKWDMWFANNEAYLDYGNPHSSFIIFDNFSNPNSRTISGAESFLSLKILSNIADIMYMDVDINDNINIINISDHPIIYLGNMVDNSEGSIYYNDGTGTIFQHSHSLPSQPTSINCEENELIYTYNGEPECLLEDYYINSNTGEIEEKILPHGYVDSTTDSTSVTDALSLGDIDQDGYDEIITIPTVPGDIYVKNSNGTLVNGFPIKGEFFGIPLIANILNIEDNSPEIICREGNNIVVISNEGQRLREFSSLDLDQPLALVPYWNNNMALIDGSRLLLFDLDINNSYWLNPYSRPSGFPVSTGIHDSQTQLNGNRQSAYNYPNPITSGNTTFRFFVDSPASKVIIRIYDAAGFLVEKNLELINPIVNEYNEISWNNIQVDAGYYMAEIKPDIGTSELVRLVFIK